MCCWFGVTIRDAAMLEVSTGGDESATLLSAMESRWEKGFLNAAGFHPLCKFKGKKPSSANTEFSNNF